MQKRWWLVLAVNMGCTEPLPSTSTVDVLRILALTTPTPEVRPGIAIGVRAVWFDPIGGRRIQWRWRLCNEDLANDPRSCARGIGSTELASGEVDHVEVPAAMLALSGTERSRTWMVYALACPSSGALIAPAEGRLECSDGSGSESFRRVTVHAQAPLNEPPAIGAWTVEHAGRLSSLEDGTTVRVGSLVGCAGDCASLTLTLTPAPGASERFGETTESLLGSVYVSSGSVSPPRVVRDPGTEVPMVMHWTPGRVILGGEVAQVWAVLRDQRGGESVRSVTITAR